MNEAMLDLETMGKGPNAAIVAIGAVAFDVAQRAIGGRFYRAVDLSTSVSLGGVMDATTVLWWLKRGDAARTAITTGHTALGTALLDFADWLRITCGAEPRVWGNGAAFDNVILRQAYQAAGVPLPWAHWHDRCYRTVKALHPGVPVYRVGTHHQAADDAETQARHLIAMLNPAAEVLA